MGSRASYSSPSKIAACFTGPAIPAVQCVVSVPIRIVVPSAKTSSRTARKAGLSPFMPSAPVKVTILSAHQPGVTCADSTFCAPAAFLNAGVMSYVNERLVLSGWVEPGFSTSSAPTHWPFRYSSYTPRPVVIQVAFTTFCGLVTVLRNQLAPSAERRLPSLLFTFPVITGALAAEIHCEDSQADASSASVRVTLAVLQPKTATAATINTQSFLIVLLIYFGNPKAWDNSFIWASVMPSGSKPMLRPAMYICAALFKTSTWSKASIMSTSTANTPCFSHITTS